jgi:hypothetical protein
MQRHLSNEDKAKLYNQMLFQYQRLQEQVRLIKAENLELNENQIREVQRLETQMKKIFNDTQRLY